MWIRLVWCGWVVLLVIGIAGCETVEPIKPGGIAIGRRGELVLVGTDRIRFEYDLSTGRYTCVWAAGESLHGAAGEVRLADGSELRTDAYGRHAVEDGDAMKFSDALGRGLMLTLHHYEKGKPELRQHFWVYADRPYFLVDVEVVGSDVVLASNHMAALSVDQRVSNGGLKLGVGREPRVLFLPSDHIENGGDSGKPGVTGDADSYEMMAIYDNDSQHGFVVGSVSRDLWRTVIKAGEPGLGWMGRLEVYGDESLSRDALAHGMVTGATIASPRILVGYFLDWREGVKVYGDANVRLRR